MCAARGRGKADLKVVILGSSNVGKTALICRYIEGKFNAASEDTIGASFSLKKWGPYNVAIWDTAGGERFHGLSSFYCRGAGAAILAYDLNCPDSFELLRTRFIPLLESAEDNCLCVVVGTKSDLVSPQQVTSSASPSVSAREGVRLAREMNKDRHFASETPYFETSSLLNRNVTQVFDYILQTLLPLDKAHTVDEMRAKRSGSLVDLDAKQKDGATTSPSKRNGCC